MLGKRWNIVGCLLVALCALALVCALPNVPHAKETTSSEESTPTETSVTSEEFSLSKKTPYSANEILVTLASKTSAEELVASFAQNQLLTGTTIAKVTDGYVKLALPTKLTVDEALVELSTSNLVDAVQPNYHYHTFNSSSKSTIRAQSFSKLTTARAAELTTKEASKLPSPNDTYYAKQWALASVNAPAAWNLVAANTIVKEPVTVAILDSGFNINHEDLASNVVDYFNVYTGKSALDTKEAAHGSHVAGIVGAMANNGKGIAGVGDNMLGLMLLKVGDPKGGITTDTIVDAYAYLVKRAKTHNVRVVNMSLGADSRTSVSRATDPAFYDAISKARKAGIVTVVAASNAEDYRPPFYSMPSDFDNVVSVINLARANNADGLTREGSSNFNRLGQRAKNISAPGTSIMSLGAGKTSYSISTGTSMASPLVAGIFGLMFTVNPSLTPAQATDLLYASARDLTACWGAGVGWDYVTGYGEVDAEAAVRAACAARGVGGADGASVAGASESGRLNIANCTISVTNKTYTGKALKPSVEVKSGTTILRAGVDYVLKYRDNKALGKATVSVLGRGSYCGIKMGTFTIKAVEPKATKLCWVKFGKNYLIAKWKKQTTRASGYQLQLARNAKFTNGRKTITVPKTSVVQRKVGSLRRGATYYVRVRTYKAIGSTRFYSPWSSVVSAALTT